MNRMRLLPFTAAILIAIATLISGGPALYAQEMDHSRPTVPSTQLTIRGLDGKSTTITADDLAAMAHKTVSVYNEHTKASEKYAGVPLADLLAKVNVPLGEKVRGKLFMTAVIAEGTDKYSVRYALAEVDPSIHTGDVIVADSMDGQKLGKDGLFKIVSTEEKRPARWVRNLAEISVIAVNTDTAK
jgi:hypothetical protein